MEEPEITVTRSKTAKNIRVIVPMERGTDFIFKSADLQEVIRRMCLKISYLAARVHEVEAENTALLGLSAKVLAEGDGK